MPSGTERWQGLTPVQMVGFLLWRSGLILVASYSVYRVARIALAHADLPLQLEVGFGLTATGAVFVMGSLIAERIVDARSEDLTE